MPSSLDHKLLALLHNVVWNNVIMVQCWHLDVHSFNTIARNEANLGLLSLVSHQWRHPCHLQTDEPFNDTLDLRHLAIERNVFNLHGSESTANSICSCIDCLHFIERLIGLGGLSDDRPVVARLSLGMWVIGWVSQCQCSADRVPNPDRLVHGGSCQELYL